MEPTVALPPTPKIAEENEVILRLTNHPRIRIKLGETVLLKTAGDYVYWKPVQTETITYEALVTKPNYDLIGKSLAAADVLLTTNGLVRNPNTLTYQKSGSYELVVSLSVIGEKVVEASEDAFIPLNLSDINGLESWRLKQTRSGKGVFEAKSKNSTLGWHPTTKARISAVIG